MKFYFLKLCEPFALSGGALRRSRSGAKQSLVFRGIASGCPSTSLRSAQDEFLATTSYFSNPPAHLNKNRRPGCACGDMSIEIEMIRDYISPSGGALDTMH